MRALVVVVLVACATTDPSVRLVDDWPAVSRPDDYQAVTSEWTRKSILRGEYQEALELSATFKSPEWRAAHTAKDIETRGLTGEARDQLVSAAQADAAGPYEVEMLVTTWDRTENDLDRGKRSVWHIALVDDQNHQIAPIEIVRDKRPPQVVHAEFPAFHDFTIAYIARFPRTTPVLGPGVHQVKLSMSSERGGVELVWKN